MSIDIQILPLLFHFELLKLLPAYLLRENVFPKPIWRDPNCVPLE